MLRTFRAPLVPTLILIGEMVASKWTSAWLVDVLIGFTLFWLVASILGNKAIVRRLPWLRERPTLASSRTRYSAERRTVTERITQRNFPAT